MARGQQICTTCGTTGQPKSYIKGSFAVEVLLWCFFGFGIFYTLWRHTTKRRGCPQCETGNMIPLDSPMGQKLLGELQPKAAEGIRQTWK